MKFKATGLIMVVAMLMGLAALPAAAASKGNVTTGVFQGTASVGKVGTCNNDGTYSGITGGGLGLPPTSKNLLKWGITAAILQDVVKGTGTGSLCGHLNKPLGPDNPGNGLGASCVSTKGWNGHGEITFGSGLKLFVSNISWKAALGPVFPITGHIGTAKGNKSDLLTGVVVANPDDPFYCLNKTDTSKSADGAQTFTVGAVYQIVPGAGGLVAKKSPTGKK